MTNSQKVAKILLEIDAITLNPKKPYRYASGILSPVYTDCRILLSYPKRRKTIRDLYIKAIKDSGIKFDLIAGTATAGIPHAAWISEKMNLPMIYVRGKSKDHGKENLIEGKTEKGQIAAVIEDLVSTGDSSVNTATAVRKAGGKAPHVFSIITYGMKKSKDNFKRNRLKTTTLTTFDEVVTQAEKMGQITDKEKQVILEWAKDPPSWGMRMGFE